MLPAHVDVLVVGAGPAGLATAVTLASRGVDVAVVDRLAAGANTSRAAVVHARTLEVLDTIGVADELVSRGIPAARFTIRDRDRTLVPVRFDGLPTRYPYALMVSQAVTEAVLLDRLAELGVKVNRPLEAVGLSDGAVTFALGERIRARYVVGADGMHSTIRDLAGIGFGGEAGRDPAVGAVGSVGGAGGRASAGAVGGPGGRGDDRGESFVLADVRVHGDLPHDEVILYFSRAGMLVWAPLPDGSVRLVAQVDDPPEHPTVADVQALLGARGPAGGRSRVTEVIWGSRFRVHHRVADTFRAGRVLLAGDAGHVHSPAGGQGMNLGLQDGVALGNALAEVLGGASEALLDDYASRRRPIAHQVVRFAKALTRLATVPAPLRPVRNLLLATLARIPAFRRMLAWRLSGLVYR